LSQPCSCSGGGGSALPTFQVAASTRSGPDTQSCSGRHDHAHEASSAVRGACL
jgi:hypothetical protein